MLAHLHQALFATQQVLVRVQLPELLQGEAAAAQTSLIRFSD